MYGGVVRDPLEYLENYKGWEENLQQGTFGTQHISRVEVDGTALCLKYCVPTAVKTVSFRQLHTVTNNILD